MTSVPESGSLSICPHISPFICPTLSVGFPIRAWGDGPWVATANLAVGQSAQCIAVSSVICITRFGGFLSIARLASYTNLKLMILFLCSRGVFYFPHIPIIEFITTPSLRPTFLSRATRLISHRLGRSVRPSVRPSVGPSVTLYFFFRFKAI